MFEKVKAPPAGPAKSDQTGGSGRDLWWLWLYDVDEDMFIDLIKEQHVDISTASVVVKLLVSVMRKSKMHVLQQMEDAHIAVLAKITEVEEAEAKKSQFIGALRIGVFNQAAAYFVEHHLD